MVGVEMLRATDRGASKRKARRAGLIGRRGAFSHSLDRFLVLQPGWMAVRFFSCMPMPSEGIPRLHGKQFHSNGYKYRLRILLQRSNGKNCSNSHRNGLASPDPE
ncbi:hypothetical protein [Paraburkholderia sp.]|uniref:hypothetical protein n=1 Tax=Paraburkholderia sp. TaxID=1926495 RepID=UPI003D6ECCD7